MPLTRIIFEIIFSPSNPSPPHYPLPPMDVSPCHFVTDALKPLILQRFSSAQPVIPLSFTRHFLSQKSGGAQTLNRFAPPVKNPIQFAHPAPVVVFPQKAGVHPEKPCFTTFPSFPLFPRIPRNHLFSICPYLFGSFLGVHASFHAIQKPLKPP